MKSILQKLSFITWVLVFTYSYLVWGIQRLFSPPQAVPYWRYALDITGIGVIFFTSFWNANKHYGVYEIWSQYLKMLLAVVVSVFLFAAIFKNIGLVAPGGLISNNPWDAIYFSIVTWTTLGYGDFAPQPNARLFASFEAIFGYLYMALLVGTIFFHLQRIHESNKTANQIIKADEK